MVATNTGKKYLGRKFSIIFPFAIPYVAWVFLADLEKTPPRVEFLYWVAYLVFSYILANAILRWSAKRWP